jgi:hypothetical protein
MDIIELKLTDSQRAQLEPIIRENAKESRNVVFISTISPSLKGRWKWQLCSISLAMGEKLMKVLEGPIAKQHGKAKPRKKIPWENKEDLT